MATKIYKPLLGVGYNSIKLLLNPEHPVTETIVQILFKTHSPGKKDMAAFQEQEYNFRLLVIHSSYVINLARAWTNHTWWLKVFVEEIKAAHELKAQYIIVHTGNYVSSEDKTPESGLETMLQSLLKVHEDTKADYSDVKILIETPSGQGTELCATTEALGEFYRRLTNHSDVIAQRFKICVDTCHIFAAGYDIRTTAGIKAYFRDFERHIGLKNLKLLHLNDSVEPLGSKIDRHANIGQGCIGKIPLLNIANYCRRKKIPMILETPEAGIENDITCVTKALDKEIAKSQTK